MVNSIQRIQIIFSQISQSPSAKIIEPFSGNHDIVKYIKEFSQNIESYDIDPKTPETIKQDTILNPPDYTESYVITNPPYLARNKATNKEAYDKYNTNDLYKCFLATICHPNNQPLGGILILPASFLLSPRKLDIECRHKFLSIFAIHQVNYFEEQVFDDTTTTVIAFNFTKSAYEMDSQLINITKYPSKQEKQFSISSINSWIIGGDIYNIKTSPDIVISRYITKSAPTQYQTYMTLSALDGGTSSNRIKLLYKKDYIYQAKESSRTYATLIINKELSAEEQEQICQEFNSFIEDKRNETWSLFLPQYRESKEYARKRIPFTLAYKIINHMLISS